MIQIGIVGGMGSLATADFFQKLVRAFPAQKEWDRPRVIVDNNCLMPSRVRAILYGERRTELVDALGGSIAGLVNLGCTDIVLACNTSHVFWDEALACAQKQCGDKGFTAHHIVRILGESLRQKGVARVSLIATEGTILSGIYENTLSSYGVAVDCEGESAFEELRYLIECVKQDAIDEETVRRFIALLSRQRSDNVVLGCTEFPILRNALGQRERELPVRLYDPLEETLDVLKARFQTK